MKDVMGLIYTTKDDIALRELTISRAVAALPVIGRYRIIDFVLSSMVNSGIKNVGIIMQKNYHSLMDHLGAGKEWDLHTKNDGLFILPPFQTRENVGTYEGTIDGLRSNISYLRRSKQEYVIMSGSYSVFNTTFNDMVAEHIEKGADITMMYTREPFDNRISSSTIGQHNFLKLDAEGNVLDIEVGPNPPTYDCFSMSVLLMKRKLLLHMIDQAVSHGMHDMHRDIQMNYLRPNVLKIRGYEYKGYHKRVESIPSFFHLNMDMLDTERRHAFFDAHPVYTKVRDEVPAKFALGARAVNSLVADGCIIEGTVENSVLFRGVRVRRGAIVRNSILMQECDISENVELENVIFDKAVTIRSGKLIGQSEYPIVIGKNMTL
ncbi:MAG: glucose-1-phosphate adenylyltransferase subunit GlgD [Clostridia bacterium]